MRFDQGVCVRGTFAPPGRPACADRGAASSTMGNTLRDLRERIEAERNAVGVFDHILTDCDFQSQSIPACRLVVQPQAFSNGLNI